MPPPNYIPTLVGQTTATSIVSKVVENSYNLHELSIERGGDPVRSELSKAATIPAFKIINGMLAMSPKETGSLDENSVRLIKTAAAEKTAIRISLTDMGAISDHWRNDGQYTNFLLGFGTNTVPVVKNNELALRTVQGKYGNPSILYLRNSLDISKVGGEVELRFWYKIAGSGTRIEIQFDAFHFDANDIFVEKTAQRVSTHSFLQEAEKTREWEEFVVTVPTSAFKESSDQTINRIDMRVYIHPPTEGNNSIVYTKGLKLAQIVKTEALAKSTLYIRYASDEQNPQASLEHAEMIGKAMQNAPQVVNSRSEETLYLPAGEYERNRLTGSQPFTQDICTAESDGKQHQRLGELFRFGQMNML